MSEAVQFIVDGDEKLVLGFVRGLFIGARLTDWPVFNDQLGIETESFAEQLKGWVGIHEQITHFVVSDDAALGVLAGLSDPRCKGITLREARVVKSASFSFKFKVFTEEAGQQVRDIFGKVPPEVLVTGFEPEETVRADNTQGVELYSPVHHYKLEGDGTVAGDFRNVLYVHEQARRLEQIDETVLQLELGDTISTT